MLMRIIQKLRENKRQLGANERGSIITELALTMPLFVTLFIGTVETGNLIMMHLKAQHAANAIGDLVTRDEEISEAVLTDIFRAAEQVMQPLDVTNSRMIVSAISQNASVASSIFWQRTGVGSLVEVSKLGVEGDSVTAPGSLTLRDDETIIFVEYYYEYEPMLFDIFPDNTIYKVAYLRPRIGSLQTVLP